MTRDEFEALMETDGWNMHQRKQWAFATPICDADTFRREMSRADGLIEFKRVADDTHGNLFWKRVFKKRTA